LDLATDVADEIGQASGGKPTNGIGFLLNCRLVAWDVVGKLRDLHSYDAGKSRNDAQGDEDGQNDRGNPPYAGAANEVGQWGQNEAEQNCQGDRDENFAPEIERGHDDNGDGKGGQAAEARRLGRYYLGPSWAQWGRRIRHVIDLPIYAPGPMQC